MLQNLRVRDRFILGKVNEDLEDRPYGMKSFPRCAGTLGKSAANRNLAGNGLRGDRSACGIRQNYISQKKNSGPLHFGSLASRGAYAPLLARTKNRNAKDRLLGHDVRCWKRCNKGRYRQHRAQSRGPTLLKLHRPLSGTLLRFDDNPSNWIDRLLQQGFATLPTINKLVAGTRAGSRFLNLKWSWLRLPAAVPEPAPARLTGKLSSWDSAGVALPWRFGRAWFPIVA